jgi:hypothetical protein
MTTAWMRQARERQQRWKGDESRRFGDAQDEARQAYAAWFDGLRWDWFATFTLAMGARESAAFAWRSLSRWSGMMHTESGRQLRQVAALEYQRRGTAHLHNLVHGVRPGADPMHAARLWQAASGGGLARIEPYRAAGGAASYCAKYVTKDMELRLIGPWPPHRGPQLF